MKKLVAGAMLGSLALGLAACGDTVGEQAIIGGAVGAGAAAVTSGTCTPPWAIGGSPSDRSRRIHDQSWVIWWR